MERRLAEAQQQIDELVRTEDLARIHLEQAELLVLKGWCRYRIGYQAKDFAGAKAVARAAQEIVDIEWADELLAQVAGVEGDDPELERLIGKRPKNVGIANAVVIRARARDSTISHERVEEIAERFGVSAQGTKGANVLHNAGRFKLEKSRGEDDLVAASRYLDRAIELYGTKQNYHHRAAAHNWQREVLEKMDSSIAALGEAMKSYALWYHQCEFEPSNNGFKQNLMNAGDHVKRLARLTAKTPTP